MDNFHGDLDGVWVFFPRGEKASELMEVSDQLCADLVSGQTEIHLVTEFFLVFAGQLDVNFPNHQRQFEVKTDQDLVEVDQVLAEDHQQGQLLLQDDPHPDGADDGEKTLEKIFAATETIAEVTRLTFLCWLEVEEKLEGTHQDFRDNLGETGHLAEL